MWFSTHSIIPVLPLSFQTCQSLQEKIHVVQYTQHYTCITAVFSDLPKPAGEDSCGSVHTALYLYYRCLFRLAKACRRRFMWFSTHSIIPVLPLSFQTCQILSFQTCRRRFMWFSTHSIIPVLPLSFQTCQSLQEKIHVVQYTQHYTCITAVFTDLPKLAGEDSCGSVHTALYLYYRCLFRLAKACRRRFMWFSTHSIIPVLPLSFQTCQSLQEKIHVVQYKLAAAQDKVLMLQEYEIPSRVEAREALLTQITNKYHSIMR